MTGNSNIDRYSIFMADDDIDDLELMESAFKEVGFNLPIKCFSEGQKLLDYLLEHMATKPVVILLDLNMPKHDGKSILDKIRRYPEFETISLIVYSTSNAQADILEAYRLGCNAYVIKPNCYNEIKKIASGIKHLWLDADSVSNPQLNTSFI